MDGDGLHVAAMDTADEADAMFTDMGFIELADEFKKMKNKKR